VTRYEIITTGWGAFAYVEDSGRLLATYLPQARADVLKRLRAEWPAAVEAHGMLPELCDGVAAYFEGDPVEFRTLVDLSRFTPFQQSVLKACARLSYGQTASYADLAASAGKPLAARAVGNTMARNTCPLIIPCHRVLRCGGGLGGFSGPEGTVLKQRMLDWEASHVADARPATRPSPRRKSQAEAALVGG
jgi:methylated-DNA-[protein]-cysteine S-methyltransferase